ncbi:hypothetical protein [Defluviimonas sp. SAOS-178_SWC]|uniref:hypothetical protein n=1 Tax=Defluviimonas sp. SAOS-178_SWC TaxID=3121287 RepID=UPI003221548D
MTWLVRGLVFAGGHGRLLLVLGLVAGVLLPDLALAMKPWLQELVALLLFVAALRVGPGRAVGSLRGVLPTLGLTLVYQLALPLCAAAIATVAGIADTPGAIAIVLMLAAAPISGSPNLAILSGADPAPAFRLLILGTALLPLTVIPVFQAMPTLGEGGDVFRAAGRLLGVIAFAAGAAFLLRRTLLREAGETGIRAIDGASAITMAVVVIGLMSAVGPAIRSMPATLFAWLALATAANFGAQIGAAVLLGKAAAGPVLPALAIVAGNRNIALFLVALPAATTDQILMFIGCYQIPMYLTPLMLAGFHRRMATA